ncbi:hypothetical protein DYBT9275_00347 [Dyadobacter sp. CECT 9275]|uniref:Lipoprotein n=2 Tax=Dyadobacter helix TaxID=2822344 RepID=A0A916J797_9BACT|nr:hypothetical protein DYBT9275_00347 [Dyadobacter sp. CECT 9275]
MKYRFLLHTAILFASLYLLTGCQTKTSDEPDTVSDSIAIANPTQEELNSDQSALLQEILGSSSEGVLRGITFGDPISKVKATETYEMFEELPDHLGYTHETAQLETIDIQYFLTKENTVNKIAVDVYLNSDAATRQLWQTGQSHFTEKYGTAQGDKKLLTWNKNSVKIRMEDVSQGKDFGLKFEFTPTDKNALAAN